MVTELQEYLIRPALYERTGEPFWNDPHISTQMLEAHLNVETDAASRKPEFITRCADWILTLPLPQGARLLDIGCGPGLYTREFAAHGLRVTGLDFSANSVAWARAHDPASEYLLQNYLAMEFENTFDIVTLIYYDYGALIPDERRELLHRVHRALKASGLFVFDVLTPLWSRARSESTSWELNASGGFWSPQPHLCLNACYTYTDTAEARRTVVVEKGAVRCYNIWDCFFTRESLLEEVTPAGFVAHGFFSDVTGQPYREDSPTLCAVLQKAGPA